MAIRKATIKTVEPSIAERRLIVALWVLARRAAEVANGDRAGSWPKVAQILLATHEALVAGAGIDALVTPARAILRKSGRKREVSWATKTAVDKDAELIRFCDAAIRRAKLMIANGEPDNSVWLDWQSGASRFLELRHGRDVHGAADLKELAAYLAAKLDLSRIGDVASLTTSTPTKLARATLIAIGISPASLKNFGAGTSKRAPNGSRKP